MRYSYNELAHKSQIYINMRFEMRQLLKIYIFVILTVTGMQLFAVPPNVDYPWMPLHRNCKSNFDFMRSCVDSISLSSETPTATPSAINYVPQVSQTEIVVDFGRPLDQLLRTRKFGKKQPHPKIRKKNGQRVVRDHDGIDLNARSKSDVYAVYDGIITFAGEQNGYGCRIEITHKAPKGFLFKLQTVEGKDLAVDSFVTTYSHLARMHRKSCFPSSMKREINKGEVIAKSGNTGESTGPHLHFEIKINGEYYNPENFIKCDRILK